MGSIRTAPVDPRTVQTDLMELDRKMYGAPFSVTELLQDLDGPLQNGLATSFATLIRSKFEKGKARIREKLKVATKAAMLLSRDMQSRTCDFSSAKDDYKKKYYPNLLNSLQEVQQLLDTFRPYTKSTTPYEYVQQSRPKTYNERGPPPKPYATENFQSYYPKFGTPHFLRDLGFEDFTQFQYPVELLAPTEAVGAQEQRHPLSSLQTVNGQEYLAVWVIVFKFLLSNPGANDANWKANVKNLRAVWTSATAPSGQPVQLPPLTQTSDEQLEDPVFYTTGKSPNIVRIPNDQAALYKPYRELAFRELTTFETMLKLIYGAFNKFTPDFTVASVDFDDAKNWIRQVIAEGRQLQFTSPSEDVGLDFIIQRAELEALRLELLEEEQLKQMFVRERLDALKSSLRTLLPPRNCQGVQLAVSNSRYSIQSVLVQLVRGVARSPDLYSNSHINFILMGDAGAGKTYYARVIASVLKNSGLLLSADPIDIISKPELVGDAIGQTAPKTKARLIRDLQNVMFIDEAYTLTQLDTSKSDQATPTWEQYGFEAIGELINFLDKNKGDISVIAAGYEKDMKEKFLKINEGMPRRFPFQILLPNYTPEELAALFCTFLSDTFNTRNRVSAAAEQLLIGVIRQDYSRRRPVLFPNSAGDIENVASSAAGAVRGDSEFSTENMEDALNDYSLKSRNNTYTAVLALPDLGGEVPGAAADEVPPIEGGGVKKTTAPAYFGFTTLE
jgi:hypothetical protein